MFSKNKKNNQLFSICLNDFSKKSFFFFLQKQTATVVFLLMFLKKGNANINPKRSILTKSC
jgi:hypothetical protein